MKFVDYIYLNKSCKCMVLLCMFSTSDPYLESKRATCF